MEEVQRLAALCDKMGPSKGDSTRGIAGYAELPQIFGLLGTVITRLEQRINLLEQSAMSQDNPLIDLIEQVKTDKDAGKYPVQIDPKKYGFDTEEDYWRRIRELAGVPPKKG
jgi:hypothetical protein